MIKQKKFLEIFTITWYNPTDSYQLGEHVRSARAGARLWFQANTGVTRELAPAGRLGDAGRFLDWNPWCPCEFPLVDRRGRERGELYRTRAVQVRVPFSDSASRIWCPPRWRTVTRERSGKRARGWRSANELARVSLGGRYLRATGASAGGGRPGLSRCSRADRREPTCSRLDVRGRDTTLRLFTVEDLS